MYLCICMDEYARQITVIKQFVAIMVQFFVSISKKRTNKTEQIKVYVVRKAWQRVYLNHTLKKKIIAADNQKLTPVIINNGFINCK